MDSVQTLESIGNDGFRRAIEVLQRNEEVGGQVAMAKLCRRTQSAVSKRLRKGKPVWDDSVLTVETATGIPRYELRPDLYPREEYAHLPVPSAGPNPEPARSPGTSGNLTSPAGESPNPATDPAGDVPPSMLSFRT